jgi:uncharacterized membrane protein YfcA
LTAAASLRAALGTGYRHSMRLVLLNCAVGAVAAIAAAGAAYALPLAFVAIAAGPLVAALVHCAVVATRTDELAWSDAHDGLRLHWRLGLALGALAAAGVSLGVLAIRFYSQHGVWPLSAFAAYVLASFCVWQLVAWPLAVAGTERPLASAARELLHRPLSAFGLGAALLVVNGLGTLAVIPLLTLTLAYSFLAAAHFVLPPEEAST